MDYKRLLIKYIDHVIDCEGVEFIEGGCPFTPDFSEAEWAELKELSKEVEAMRSSRRL